MIIRLYDAGEKDCGAAIFKDYGDKDPEVPVGDFGTKRASAYYDITFYEAFIGILRIEDELYWKIAWTQTGAAYGVSDISLDTKKEIIGEFFPRTAGG